jgi:hypothetical protein
MSGDSWTRKLNSEPEDAIGCRRSAYPHPLASQAWYRDSLCVGWAKKDNERQCAERSASNSHVAFMEQRPRSMRLPCIRDRRPGKAQDGPPRVGGTFLPA